MISALRMRVGTLRAFFMGDLYPIVICFLVAVGSISGLEFYFCMIHVALIFTSLAISHSVRPMLPSLLTAVMQLSVNNSPFYPNYSDYYYTGWRLPVFITMCALCFAAIVIFVVRNAVWKRISLKKTPCLIPILVFSAALLVNGAFSGKWVLGDLIFGAANVAVYLVLFLLVYHGFSSEEDSRGIARYLSYLAMLVALVIIAELAALFLTNDSVFADGVIVKEEVALGWGIWNLVGVSLSSLIPLIFYGVHYNKYPWLYFAVATLAYLFSVLTMSRNALAFSTLAYGACVLISCFKGKNKRVFRIISVASVVAFLLAIIVLFDKVKVVFEDYFDRGFSDNGRFALWRAAFDNFLDSFFFGGGFYGFEVPDSILTPFGPLAKQAHNTVLQLLSATGVVGFLSYAYYRYSTLKPVFIRPTLKKIFMLLSIAVILGGSLLDNFIFNIYPLFSYTIALAVIHKEAEEDFLNDGLLR